MPKIIENLENRLIDEARKQIQEQGYSAVTIRSVANACGVGVGTVYNYFTSKDDLLAAYMLQDWKQSMDIACSAGAHAQSPLTVLETLYVQICGFVGRYEDVFRDPEARVGFSPNYTRYHRELRNQIAAPIRKFCESDFAADFVAEAMLTWTLAGRSFEELYGMIEKLF